jgi:hypothetical protein
MNKMLMIFMCLSLTGCTYSINLVHTASKGHAYDIVDDADTTTPTVPITL